MARKRTRNAKPLRAVRGRKPQLRKNSRFPMQAASAGSLMSIPRQIAFPDSFRTELRYEVPLTLINGGALLNSVRMTSNAFDVDPALGSTAMAGFGELALVYSRFRTLRMSYDFKIVNLELFGQSVVHGFSSTSIASGSLGQNYSENSHFSSTILGQANSSRSVGRYRRTISIATLFGTQQALFDDLFTGSTTSSTLPSSATAFAYVGLIGTGVQVSGFQVAGTITLDLLFDRKNLILG